MAPVCLLQDGRNRKYSAAASCLFLGGLCVTCIRSKTVTNVSLNLCTNRLELPPRGLSASSILKTDPHRSKNSKVNVDMFPRSFSLFWSIATKKHMQAYIFLVLAQCQKQHSECVAVSIKEYRTFGRDQCREHLFYRCFLVVTFQDCSFVRGEKNPYRISGNSFTRTATSIWMEGVSSRRMMSARWQMMLSNQEELDSWGREEATIHSQETQDYKINQVLWTSVRLQK